MYDGTIRPNIEEPETGVVQFGQHPGIYIRNAEAVVMAADLRKAMRHYDGPQTCEAKVFELITLLDKVKS